MTNTRNFFRQAIYTEELNENSITGMFKILAKRILTDFKVEYNLLELKIQKIMEPEGEEDLVKINMFPPFGSILEILGTRQRNKFYPANPSLWVVFVSCFMGILVILFVSILHSQEFISAVYKQFFIAVLGSILCIVFWVSLFYNEKIYGYHTDIIRRNITLGFWLFLFTEGLCFMSLFWTFFHSLLAASTHIGQFAPGGGVINYFLSESIIMHPYWNVFCFTDMSNSRISNFYGGEINKYTFDHLLSVRFHFNLFDAGQVIDPYGYPALNTALLLISAVLLNFGHVRLKSGKYLKSFMFLGLTLLFGLIFMGVQFLEIKGSTLQFNDGIYASSFYSLTGLHGIHVILGVFALFLCFINFIKGNYTRKRHDTFWCAVAYWHFVDVVWILVYLLIYCWPSCLYYSDVIRHSYLGYRDHCLNINIHVFEENLFQQVYAMKSNLILMLMDYYNNTQLENKKKVRIIFDTYEKTIYKSHAWLNIAFTLDFFLVKAWTIYKSSYDYQVDKRLINWKYKCYPMRADVLSAMVAHIKPNQDNSTKLIMRLLNKNSLFKEMIKTAAFDIRKDFDINLSTQDAFFFNLSNNKFLARKFLAALTQTMLEGYKESYVSFENDKSESLAIAEPEISNVLKEAVKKSCKRSRQFNLFMFYDHFIKNAKDTTNLDINNNGFDELTFWNKKTKIRWNRMLRWLNKMREHCDIRNYIYSFHDVKEFQKYIKWKDHYDYDVMFREKHFARQSGFMLAEAANLMYMGLFDLLKIKKYQDRIDRVAQYKILTYALYRDLYKNKQYINYSEITTDKNLYAVVLNILHTLAFDYLYKWAYSDFTTWRGKIKFPILIILYFININWAFTFAARFTPYLLNKDFECIWGDLLYTRKPKWLIKKE